MRATLRQPMAAEHFLSQLRAIVHLRLADLQATRLEDKLDILPIDDHAYYETRRELDATLNDYWATLEHLHIIS